MLKKKVGGLNPFMKLNNLIKIERERGKKLSTLQIYNNS